MSGAPEIKTVSLTLLRRHFETILDCAAAGQEFSVTRRGKPIFRVTPLTADERRTVAIDAARSGALQAL